MSENLPFLIILVTAGVGAALMIFTTRRMGVQPLSAGILGAGAGMLGPLIFMLPLNFCTFEAERQAIDIILGTVLIVVGMALVLIPLRWLLSRLKTGQGFEALVSGQSTQGTFKGKLTPFLLVTPTIIILVLFLYYPFLDTFRLATLLTGRSAPRSRFICLDNFTSMFDNQQYLYSLLITFVIAAAIVIIGLLLSLLVATLAYQPVKGASIYRTLLIWPYAISPVVAGVIFGLMFDPAAGVINYVTNTLFGVKLPWLTSGPLAVFAVILTSVWKSMGFNILFYIAGLQNIPNDLLEAAAIDGANAVQRFIRIIIPMLSPITFFLIITNMTYAFFDIFGTIDYLTAGGPLKATSVLIYNIFEAQRGTLGLGDAAAQSIVLFLFVIGVTIFQFRSVGSRVSYGG